MDWNKKNFNDLMKQYYEEIYGSDYDPKYNTLWEYYTSALKIQSWDCFLKSKNKTFNLFFRQKQFDNKIKKVLKND